MQAAFSDECLHQYTTMSYQCDCDIPGTLCLCVQLNVYALFLNDKTPNHMHIPQLSAMLRIGDVQHMRLYFARSASEITSTSESYRGKQWLGKHVSNHIFRVKGIGNTVLALFEGKCPCTYIHNDLSTFNRYDHTSRYVHPCLLALSRRISVGQKQTKSWMGSTHTDLLFCSQTEISVGFVVAKCHLTSRT